MATWTFGKAPGAPPGIITFEIPGAGGQSPVRYSIAGTTGAALIVTNDAHAQQLRQEDNLVLLDVEAASVAAPLVGLDMLGFYRWSAPTASYNPNTGDIWAAGTGRSRELKIARFNLDRGSVEVISATKEVYTSDDHNIPAFIIEDGREPLIACTYHDQTTTVRVRTGPLKADPRLLNGVVAVSNASAAPVSYSQLYKRATAGSEDGRLMMFRAASAWWFARTATSGASWSVGAKLHTAIYQVSRQSTGNLLHVVTTDPTDANPCVLRYWKLGLSDGIARTAAGVALAAGSSIWTATPNTATPLYPTAAMDTVMTSTGNASTRLYDVSPTGNSIAISKLTRTSQANSEYVILRRRTGATTNQWIEEPVCSSGRTFGGGDNHYFGGMWFDGPDALYLVREQLGVWTLEHWVRTGPEYPTSTATRGTWSQERTLYTISGTPGTIGATASGRWLARPVVPSGAEGLGICLVSELRQYDDTATNFVSDLILPPA